MVGLIHTIFENLEVGNLNKEETLECLYYVDYLIENEDSPESFFKYQVYKLKLAERLKELDKPHPTESQFDQIIPNPHNFSSFRQEAS